MERRRTTTATCLYDSLSFFSFYTVSHYIYLCLKKSLNDEERGGNCLLVLERSYGPGKLTLSSKVDVIIARLLRKVSDVSRSYCYDFRSQLVAFLFVADFRRL